MRKRAKKKGHWATEIKNKKKSRIKWGKIRRGGYYFLTVAFFAVAIYAFIFSGFLNIDKIEVRGVKTISAEKIIETINDLMETKRWRIFSKRNYLFFNSDEADKLLREKFKKIGELQIEKVFPDKLNISINERSALLVLCSVGNCYLVDRQGIAYEKVDLDVSNLKGTKLIKIIDESNKKIQKGENVFVPEFVKFVIAISDEVREETNLRLLNEYRIKSRVSGELIAQTDRGWDIYFDTKNPLKKSVRMLKLVLNKQIALKDFNRLEYIDLRLNNKVFYRMQGDAVKEKEDIEKEELKKIEVEESGNDE